MCEVRLTELLTYFGFFIDIHLHCLYNLKENSFVLSSITFAILVLKTFEQY
jgi:hypothetical protein